MRAKVRVKWVGMCASSNSCCNPPTVPNDVDNDMSSLSTATLTTVARPVAKCVRSQRAAAAVPRRAAAAWQHWWRRCPAVQLVSSPAPRLTPRLHRMMATAATADDAPSTVEVRTAAATRMLFQWRRMGRQPESVPPALRGWRWLRLPRSGGCALGRANRRTSLVNSSPCCALRP